VNSNSISFHLLNLYDECPRFQYRKSSYRNVHIFSLFTFSTKQIVKIMSSSFRYNLLRSVKPYTPFAPQLTKSMLRVLIQVSVHFIETKKSSSEVLSLALNKLTNSGHKIPPNFCELFTMIFLMMQTFLRYPKGVVKHHELRKCLMDDLKYVFICMCTFIWHTYYGCVSSNELC